jgi:DNA-binding LacI/PurR family transcriptional regulator
MQEVSPMRPTLQTVADAVGVSRSTVSNAYSRPDQLSQELRERIFEAARQLGYAGPDAAARTLRRGKARAIGVVFTSNLSYVFTDPYAMQYLRGVAEAAERTATGMLLVAVSLNDEADAVAAVNDAVVDGFLLYCLPDWHPALKAIQARNVPVVSGQWGTGFGDEVAFVGIDEASATEEAGEHLVDLGHRRIAIVGEYLGKGTGVSPIEPTQPDDVTFFTSRERLRGYQRAFERAGIDWADVTLVSVDRNRRDQGEAAAAHLLNHAPRPTAIVALSDILALGVLDALDARGLRPGHDVSVVGFDDIPEAQAASLTTVRQPAAERGRVSTRLLLEPPTHPAERNVVLPTELVARGSTGPAPTRRKS